MRYAVLFTFTKTIQNTIYTQLIYTATATIQTHTDINNKIIIIIIKTNTNK